jgi:hypothetical protein
MEFSSIKYEWINSMDKTLSKLNRVKVGNLYLYYKPTLNNKYAKLVKVTDLNGLRRSLP